jgi:hypothetical protein
MVDPARNKILSGCHRSGVTILVRDCVGGRHLVGAVAWIGTSSCEVSSFTIVVAPSISRVLHWPLDSMLSLHILASRSSGLSDVGAMYELALWSLIALHYRLGSLLEQSSGLLLRCMLDRFGRWHTDPGPRVVATLSLALLLPLMIHDTMVILQHQSLVHQVLKIIINHR